MAPKAKAKAEAKAKAAAKAKAKAEAKSEAGPKLAPMKRNSSPTPEQEPESKKAKAAAKARAKAAAKEAAAATKKQIAEDAKKSDAKKQKLEPVKDKKETKKDNEPKKEEEEKDQKTTKKDDGNEPKKEEEEKDQKTTQKDSKREEETKGGAKRKNSVSSAKHKAAAKSKAAKVESAKENDTSASKKRNAVEAGPKTKKVTSAEAARGEIKPVSPIDSTFNELHKACLSYNEDPKVRLDFSHRLDEIKRHCQIFRVGVKDKNGDSALHHAARFDFVPKTSAPDYSSKKWLDEEKERLAENDEKSAKMIKILLTEGKSRLYPKDLSAFNLRNDTPLHIATRLNKPKTCALLMENGADLQLESPGNMSAYRVALRLNFEDIWRKMNIVLEDQRVATLLRQMNEFKATQAGKMQEVKAN